jgi:hypothetical protein
MTSRHSDPQRGLNATRSPLSQGRFGRMFRNLHPAQFGASDEAAQNQTALAILATGGPTTITTPQLGPVGRAHRRRGHPGTDVRRRLVDAVSRPALEAGFRG